MAVEKQLMEDVVLLTQKFFSDLKEIGVTGHLIESEVSLDKEKFGELGDAIKKILILKIGDKDYIPMDLAVERIFEGQEEK